MKIKKVKKPDILELLIDLSEKVEEVRCRVIDIDLEKADEERFSTITNKGELYKYE